MSEAGDYDPGPWQGANFTSLRHDYDVHVGRSYSDAKSTGKTVNNPSKLITKSEAPVVISCDVTGSMGDWPATIFGKLPYLDLEGKEYLGPTMEISFVAQGDAFSDNYPLQVRPFASGLELEKELKELIIEGNGGGNGGESYDLPALYYARHVEMPNAIHPIFIFIGDEPLYKTSIADKAKAVGISMDKNMPIEDVIKELQKKFAVYLVQKSYGSGGDSSDSSVTRQWEKLLGEDYIAQLPEASRVVDVIFGIFAKEVGRIDYFTKELQGRQTSAQVKTVMKSLQSIHLTSPKSMKKLPAPRSRGASVTRRTKGGNDAKPTKSLLD